MNGHDIVFIDEGGDPGQYWLEDRSGLLVPGPASRTWTMGAFCLPAHLESEFRERWLELAMALGRRPGDVLRWRNLNAPQQGMQVAQAIRASGARVRGYTIIKPELSREHLGLGTTEAYLPLLELLIGAIRRTTERHTVLEVVIDHY